MKLLVTYSNDAHRDGTFNVLVDGQKIGEQPMKRKSPEQPVHFFDVAYRLPPELVKDKKKVTVRFDGENGVPGVFGIRIVRSDTNAAGE